MPPQLAGATGNEGPAPSHDGRARSSGALVAWYLECLKGLALLVSICQEAAWELPGPAAMYRTGAELVGPALPSAASLSAGLAGLAGLGAVLGLLALGRRCARRCARPPAAEQPCPAEPAAGEGEEAEGAAPSGAGGPPPDEPPASLATEPSCVHPCWNDRSLRWRRVYEVEEIDEFPGSDPKLGGLGIQLEELAG